MVTDASPIGVGNGVVEGVGDSCGVADGVGVAVSRRIAVISGVGKPAAPIGRTSRVGTGVAVSGGGVAEAAGDVVVAGDDGVGDTMRRVVGTEVGAAVNGVSVAVKEGSGGVGDAAGGTVTGSVEVAVVPAVASTVLTALSETAAMSGVMEGSTARVGTGDSSADVQAASRLRMTTSSVMRRRSRNDTVLQHVIDGFDKAAQFSL